MNEVCLVTGGAGFIGSAISAGLVASFCRVIVVDNMHPQIHAKQTRPAALHPAAELVVADVCEPSTWSELLARLTPNVIVHLAAETGTGQSLTEASRHAAVNVLGTTRMLDALAASKRLPRKLVLASSRAVYGEGMWQSREDGATTYPGQRSNAQLQRAQWGFPGLSPRPAEAATTQPYPTSVYGATKLAQEHVLRSWAQSFGVELGVLRLQNVYGPGQSLINSYTGIVSLFVRLASARQSIPVYEDGNIVRDFVYIDDVAAAIHRVASGPVTSPTPYDIGAGKITTILDLAIQISMRYGAPPPHINGGFRNGDVRFAACDIARTTVELGWAPRFSLAEGVAALCDWIDSQPEVGLVTSNLNPQPGQA